MGDNAAGIALMKQAAKLGESFSEAANKHETVALASHNAVIAVSAKAGLGVTAGQDIQLANGETATVMSGGDTQFSTGGQLRVHSGQAIGVLGGAVAVGEGGIGMQLIAAKDAIDVQAQADVMKVQARDDVTLTSVGAHVDWAAARRRPPRCWPGLQSVTGRYAWEPRLAQVCRGMANLG